MNDRTLQMGHPREAHAAVLRRDADRRERELPDRRAAAWSCGCATTASTRCARRRRALQSAGAITISPATTSDLVTAGAGRSGRRTLTEHLGDGRRARRDPQAESGDARSDRSTASRSSSIPAARPRRTGETVRRSDRRNAPSETKKKTWGVLDFGTGPARRGRRPADRQRQRRRRRRLLNFARRRDRRSSSSMARRKLISGRDRADHRAARRTDGLELHGAPPAPPRSGRARGRQGQLHRAARGRLRRRDRRGRRAPST